MTHRERIDCVLEGRRPDKCPWVPRLDHWYNINKRQRSLPVEFEKAELAEVHRSLGAGIRIYSGPKTVYGEGSGIRETTTKGDKTIVTVISTPVGELRSRRDVTADDSYQTEWPVKNMADLKVMEYALEHMDFEYDTSQIDAYEKKFGDTTGIIFYCQYHSAIPKLIYDYMGLAATYYALNDTPEEIEHFIKVHNGMEDRLFDLAAKVPLKYINVCDHIHSDVIDPRTFKKYLLPYWQKRCDQLHRMGKYVCSHVDGSFRSLIPCLKECGFDVLEALTPQPQGDVTLEEMKEAVGENIILMDGIPATAFLPSFSLKEFEGYVKKILELFERGRNLILGISDEMPPGGEIRKVRLVSEMLEKW